MNPTVKIQTKAQIEAKLHEAIRLFFGVGIHVLSAMGVQLEPCMCGHCVGYKARLTACLHMDDFGHVNIEIPPPSAPAGPRDTLPAAAPSNGEEQHP